MPTRQCKLCEKQIKNYVAEFNELALNETNKVNICAQCINKFVKWQQSVFAKLYPTKSIKKRFGKKQN